MGSVDSPQKTDIGIWNFRYNVNNGRYITDDKENSCNFDNTNWITKEEYKEPEEPKLQALNHYKAFGMPKNDLFRKDEMKKMPKGKLDAEGISPASLSSY